MLGEKEGRGQIKDVKVGKVLGDNGQMEEKKQGKEEKKRWRR